MNALVDFSSIASAKFGSAFTSGFYYSYDQAGHQILPPIERVINSLNDQISIIETYSKQNISPINAIRTIALECLEYIGYYTSNSVFQLNVVDSTYSKLDPIAYNTSVIFRRIMSNGVDKGMILFIDILNFALRLLPESGQDLVDALTSFEHPTQPNNF